MAAGAILAVLTAVAVSFAVNAKADPPLLAVEGNNGYKTQRIYHPIHDQDSASPWYVDVAVDLQRGFQDETNDTFLSGVARISRGPGAVRVQVDAIRGAVGGYTVTDFFPSKTFGARDNTPGGIGGPCTSGSPSNESLWADVSQQVGCQQGPNRLNSDADYAGNVVLVRGYGDWYPATPLFDAPCTTTAAIRGFFAVRWADGSYGQHSLRTLNVPANPDC